MQPLVFPFPNHPPSSYGCRSTRREFSGVTDVEQLQSKFGRNGVSFTSIGDSGCVLRMELENGTAANLMLPSGLITSFKPQMWHGATMELLHTSVSQPRDKDGPALIQGGLSLSLACQHMNGSWAPNSWALNQLTGTPLQSMQVELIPETQVEDNIQMKQTITLERDFLGAEIVVSNSSTTSPVHLAGSSMCHLAVSTPDAAYAVGLQGSDYFERPPSEGVFSIIPPNPSSNKLWSFDKLFGVNVNGNGDVSLEGEEDDNYKHLTQKISRIYTSAPRSLTIIDRGRRNSVRVRRQGFKELYIFSPGSEHEWHGKYSYICIGHAAQLQPLTLNAQTQWTGGLQIINPN